MAALDQWDFCTLKSSLHFLCSFFFSLCDCLGTGAVHVTWLKSGHEVLQERSTFLLGLIGHLAQMSGNDNCDDAPTVKSQGASIALLSSNPILPILCAFLIAHKQYSQH